MKAPVTLRAYESGEKKIPLRLALACAAVANGLLPWDKFAGDSFPKWRKAMDFSQHDAAKALGVSIKTYQQLEGGIDYNTGKKRAAPPVLALACSALLAGLAPIP